MRIQIHLVIPPPLILSVLEFSGLINQKTQLKLLLLWIWESKVVRTNVAWPDRSVGKESACSAEDLGSIPGSGRSAGEGIGYPPQYSWASLVAQLVKNLPAMLETWVWSLGWRSERLPTPVFWPGEFHGPELDKTEWLLLNLNHSEQVERTIKSQMYRSLFTVMTLLTSEM